MSSSNDMYKLKIGTRVASVAVTAGLVFAGGAQQVHAQERITHPLADKTDVIASSQSKELKGNLDAHIASPSAVNPSLPHQMQQPLNHNHNTHHLIRTRVSKQLNKNLFSSSSLHRVLKIVPHKILDILCRMHKLLFKKST